MFSHTSGILTARPIVHDSAKVNIIEEIEKDIAVRTPHWKGELQ
jgi:hypothetical protein